MAKKPMTRNTLKLIDRAREIGVEVPDWIEIIRTRAGHWQRSAGAWSWYALDAKGREVMGSPTSITELLKAPALTWYYSASDVPELEAIWETKETQRCD